MTEQPITQHSCPVHRWMNSNRWKEALLSLAAGQSMVPFGNNSASIRRLSERVWALRAVEAASAARFLNAQAKAQANRSGRIDLPIMVNLILPHQL